LRRLTLCLMRNVARDKSSDLALIATDLSPPSTAKWRSSIRQGEDIIVYGFPLAGVLAAGGNVATGNVSALAGVANDERFLQISAPLQPGNSGGPLLDRSGNVVGIVVAKLDALKVASVIGDIPQNVNFAIKASVAAAFLEAHGVTHVESAATPALSTADLSDRAKGLTVQVVCTR
jgi:serine protease Do